MFESLDHSNSPFVFTCSVDDNGFKSNHEVHVHQNVRNLKRSTWIGWSTYELCCDKTCLKQGWVRSAFACMQFDQIARSQKEVFQTDRLTWTTYIIIHQRLPNTGFLVMQKNIKYVSLDSRWGPVQQGLSPIDRTTTYVFMK